MIDFAQYQYIVEKAILRLGVNPEKCLIKKSNWQLKKGSIKLNISFFKYQNQTFFKTEALIASIPNDADINFSKKLLEYNYELNGLAFYTKEGKIYLKSVRELSGMDTNEAFAMITKVGNYSDKFNKEFI